LKLQGDETCPAGCGTLFSVSRHVATSIFFRGTWLLPCARSLQSNPHRTRVAIVIWTQSIGLTLVVFDRARIQLRRPARVSRSSRYAYCRGWSPTVLCTLFGTPPDVPRVDACTRARESNFLLRYLHRAIAVAAWIWIGVAGEHWCSILLPFTSQIRISAGVKFKHEESISLYVLALRTGLRLL
ncbi:hypothetical protein B0H13DRAFT_2667295, partial [Mycena leptocephala]